MYQTQLTDFIRVRTIEKYDMKIPKDYRTARRKFPWIPLQPKQTKRTKQPSNMPSEFKNKIIDFIGWKPKLRDKYLYRFPSVSIPRYEDF